jgi:hypothetical protein
MAREFKAGKDELGPKSIRRRGIFTGIRRRSLGSISTQFGVVISIPHLAGEKSLQTTFQIISLERFGRFLSRENVHSRKWTAVSLLRNDGANGNFLEATLQSAYVRNYLKIYNKIKKVRNLDVMPTIGGISTINTLKNIVEISPSSK